MVSGTKYLNLCDMSKFGNWISNLFNKFDAFMSNLSYNFFNGTQIGRGLTNLTNGRRVESAVDNLFNRFTGNALTDADLQANELSMQNQEDIYQRQVAGMQKAGLNPALMYGSGAQSAPSSPDPQQGASFNMSELMQLFTMREQKDVLRAEAENLRASALRSEKQTEKLDTDIALNREKIRNADLDAQEKEIALQYQDAFAQADLRIKNASAENLKANFDALYAQIDKMNADTAGIMLGYLETIERIHVLQSTQNLNAAQIKELAALSNKLSAEAKHLQLSNESFDLLNGFVTNASVGLGPFHIGESGVVTLADLRSRAQAIAEGRNPDAPGAPGSSRRSDGSHRNPMDQDLP